MAYKDQREKIILYNILYMYYITRAKEKYSYAHNYSWDLQSQQIPKVQSDSQKMSGFPFVGHGNPDNNLGSHCITPVRVDTVTMLKQPDEIWRLKRPSNFNVN